MKNLDRRNKYFFGLGTIGRDMFYAFEANALLYFLSNILSLPLHVFAAVSLVLSVLRIADALNDPITGLVIDNIHTKWGKFKPAILVGGVVSVIFYLILFGNVGTGTAYVIFFAVAYVLWDISYGINDIAYWTLLPALTQTRSSARITAPSPASARTSACTSSWSAGSPSPLPSATRRRRG